MQKADIVLSKLNEKSSAEKNYKFKRLYRNLFNQDFYMKAYSKICSKEGNMTRGTSKETIDGFNMKRITGIIEKIRYEKYNPTPVRRKYIPKKTGKKRPLGIPSFNDKLIQEVIRQILESIYEPLFSKNSHGFRQGKSSHTALLQVKAYKGTNWIIEGDITGFFDNIDHEVLINILKQKIEDGRFLEIIKRFLKAGYIENGIKRETISGSPQGGIISPILSNIYLNELDQYMEKLIEENTIGKERRVVKEYMRIAGLHHYYKRTGNIEKAKKYKKEVMKIPYRDQFDPNFRRVRYVRYADDFVICIFGSKEFAQEIKIDISKFLKKKLKLELNKEKTLITNILKKRVTFLGYEIRKVKENTRYSKINGHSIRAINGTIQLSIPSKVISDKIKEFTKKGKSIHVNKRIHLPIQSIISLYNAEIRGLFNYYSLANNVSKKLYKFKFYHYYSMVKTIARKERLSVKKVIVKYGIDVRRKIGTGTRKIVGLRYSTREGEKILTYFNDSIKKRRYPIIYDSISKDIPNDRYSELLCRLSKEKCELCNKKGNKGDLEIHHIRKLKTEIEKYTGEKLPEWLWIMKKIHRKSLVLCNECHKNLHRL